MKFTFTKEHELGCQFDRTNIVLETETVTLSDLLSDFADFLRACGFSVKGQIEIIDEDGEGGEV